MDTLFKEITALGEEKDILIKACQAAKGSERLKIENEIACLGLQYNKRYDEYMRIKYDYDRS